MLGGSQWCKFCGGTNTSVILNCALLMVLCIVIMNFMTITDIEAKKYKRNEQLTKVRCLYCDILEIFLATNYKYFSFLIFLQVNSTKNAFSIFSAPDTSLDSDGTVIDNTCLNIFTSERNSLTWFCRTIFLPLVSHGKMAVFCR